MPDEWEIKPEELKLGPRIGIGSFGEVFRGSWRYTDGEPSPTPTSPPGFWSTMRLLV